MEAVNRYIKYKTFLWEGKECTVSLVPDCAICYRKKHRFDKSYQTQPGDFAMYGKNVPFQKICFNKALHD